MSTDTRDLATAEIIIRIEGRAGRITLDRPKALNALTMAQVTAIRSALQRWAGDDRVRLVILDGAGDRAMCAGGDVIAMYDSRPAGPEFADRYWCDEYRLNAEIHGFGKPFVALMTGFVMGGGIGLAGHASHRIVTDSSQLAMPETAIGLIPDVGGTWLLAHAPGRLGVFLGLTGDRMGPADAIYAGFADTFVPQTALTALVAALVDPAGEPIGVTIAGFAGAPPAAVLAPRQAEIDRLCAGGSVEAIIAALGASDLAWAMAAATALAKRSPLAMKLTLAAIEQARGLRRLEQALAVEFRLATRLFRHGEFTEGIRALLVDKDRAPRWNPADLASVTPALVDRFMAPFGPGEDQEPPFAAAALA